ncbi:protein LEG1 homolog [Orycteropus afer afer]|uniref:Protein LEG1 homolog n=1 Tax=Orycteropus afer afer TaxID=1230840 RepID=A0AC54Z498_ORYAF|nr:protein LEG1 homolog [Orycteropus afer afer]
MAFLLLLAYVIAGCLSAASAGTCNLLALYPPLWEESPGQFNVYQVKNGQYIIDAWVYPERMGMYKILLTQTAKYFERFSPENEQNILWGLPLQHGWQYNTGRLADPTNATNCGYESDHLCISVNSWWADINYFLCALPFLSAVDSGVMGISSDQVTILPPPKDQMLFCFDVFTCRSLFPKTMDKWNAFYQNMKLPSSSFEGLLKYLWAAHTSTLQDVLKIFETRLQNYAKPEADFERSWSLAVEYIAASNFPTTLIRIHEFQKGLPPRMLVTGDKAPFISDFTFFQNIVLFSLNSLYEVANATGSLSLTIWKHLMKTEFARKLVLTNLEIVLIFTSSLTKTIDEFKINNSTLLTVISN